MLGLNMPPVFWLIDTYIPGLKLSYGIIDFKGKILIISEQLWSILKEDLVRSMLIGPGFIFGKGEIKGYPVEVKEPIISVILDATELRPNQEVPLLDLMSPDVIDPTSKADIESIIISIKKVFREHGQVLFPEKIAEVREKGKIPISIGIEDVSEKISVKSFSGKDKIRFVLGGENNLLYSNFRKLLQSNKFTSYENMNILRSDIKRLDHIDSAQNMDNWIIVEKTTELDDIPTNNFIQNILKEFNRINNEVKNNIEYYLIS
jgi:hypothetical protein